MNPTDQRPAAPQAIPLDHEQAPLWEELQQALEAEGKADLERLALQVREADWSGTSAGLVLQRALERADADALLTMAHRLGREWMAAG